MTQKEIIQQIPVDQGSLGHFVPSYYRSSRTPSPGLSASRGRWRRVEASSTALSSPASWLSGLQGSSPCESASSTLIAPSSLLLLGLILRSLFKLEDEMGRLVARVEEGEEEEEEEEKRGSPV